MNPIHTGIIRQGTVILDNRSRYDQKVKSLEGERIELVLRKQKSQRSLNQNNYMWGVVYEILSQHLGYTSDEMHEICKFKFLKTMRAGLEYVRSTTKLNTSEMEEYLEKIRKWADIELNCFVPLPNECEP